MSIIDMHCDTVSELYSRRKQGLVEELSSNQLCVDLERLMKAGYILQNFAIFTDIGKEENPFQCAKGQIDFIRKEINKNSDKIREVKTIDDILENRKAGRISALLTLEEGEVCGGKEEKLEEFYNDGIRMMTFCWNYDNSLATKAGLTEKGISFLAKMEKLGMIPDVSHLSEAGFYDVFRYAKKPFVASHSNAATLCGHKRNLSDDMIRKIAEKGGVIGINFYGLFLENKPRNGVYYSKVSRIADHIFHMIQVGGISCVGLGSDFDGFSGESELTDCSKLYLLERELKKRGILESELDAVFYKNILNLYQETLRNSW